MAKKKMKARVRFVEDYMDMGDAILIENIRPGDKDFGLHVAYAIDDGKVDVKIFEDLAFYTNIVGADIEINV